MTTGFFLLQAGTPTSALDMVTGGTLPTKVVLGALAVFSLFSWWIILWKARQFREVQKGEGVGFRRAVWNIEAFQKVLSHQIGNLFTLIVTVAQVNMRFTVVRRQ